MDLSTLMQGPASWESPDGEARFWMLEKAGPSALWVGRFRGTSPWERHANGDELLYVVEGEVEVTMLRPEGEARTRLGPGSIHVVPAGHWHRHRSTGWVVELGATPQPSELSDAEDPR